MQLVKAAYVGMYMQKSPELVSSRLLSQEAFVMSAERHSLCLPALSFHFFPELVKGFVYL